MSITLLLPLSLKTVTAAVDRTQTHLNFQSKEEKLKFRMTRSMNL